MKKGKYLFSIVFLLMLSMGLSSCYVGYYGGRGRGYYNRGPHHHHYPGHYHHHYR